MYDHIKHLMVFDFDETLFRMPGYTDRFSVERLNPKLDFPTPYSFYDHSTSMDPTIHNIQLIEPVYNDWKLSSSDPNTRTILITHRLKELQPEAELLLKMYNIVFDEMYFLGRVTEKVDTLDKELTFLPNIEEITIYEDSLEQLRKYQDFFYQKISRAKSVKNLDDIVSLNMQFVDKSRVIQLYEFSAGRSRKIKLI
jgi:hypothetical protein